MLYVDNYWFETICIMLYVDNYCFKLSVSCCMSTITVLNDLYHGVCRQLLF